MSYLFSEETEQDGAPFPRSTSQCRAFTHDWLYLIKRDGMPGVAWKPHTATVRLAVQPGDYVNVAHGGATDASRRLSHLRFPPLSRRDTPTP